MDLARVIEEVKEKIKRIDGKEGQAEAMLRALKKLEEEVKNTAARKGSLKKGESKESSDVNNKKYHQRLTYEKDPMGPC